jgi:D-lactate dehydrogenase (cytochrome)
LKHRTPRLACINRHHLFAGSASSATTTVHLLTRSRHTSTRLESIEQLHTKLSSESELITNPYELERHGRGESYHPTKRPDAILRPASVQDVSQILSYCQENSIPVVPFGVGTSVEGHVCCLQGGISLDTSLFQTIETPSDLMAAHSSSEQEEDTIPDPIARVGAGVTRMTLNNALRHTGMQFVVDPGADATIGGMVATGASGTTAVRYGTMRENILEVECVLADGTIVHTGTQALKNSAGYDLVSLLCGSEGTLGVITSVTVKLHPIPQHVTAAVCVFDSLKEAAEAVAMFKLCGIPMLRCELLDGPSVAAFNNYKKDSPDRTVAPTLFLEFSASSEIALKEQVQMTASICDDFGGSEFEFTSGEEERKALWAARHTLYYASINLRPGAKDAILTDACVPISKFAQLIEATAKDVKELGVVGPCFGHAGDGNFHCILPVVEGDSEDYTNKLHEVNNRLIRRTLELGGTCTGEHGVGYGKIKYLEQQYGAGAVKMMKAIKQSLDPNQIMNPGKVVIF